MGAPKSFPLCREKRSGPAATLLRQAAKANGRFTITFAPRTGSWGYRLAFVGPRPPVPASG